MSIQTGAPAALGANALDATDITITSNPSAMAPAGRAKLR